MTDEAIRRGRAAEALLSDPLMVEARDSVRAQLMAAWEQAEVPEIRERIWHAVKAHTKLFQYLEDIIVTGKMSDPELAELARKAATPP